MFNNRKYINDLIYHNEKLTEAKEWFRKSSRYWQETSHEKSKEITNLKKDIESKENSVCNLLEANKELSLSNNYLENKIKLLEQVIKQHEENEYRLNTKLCRVQGQLDKIDNYTRMLERRGINE